MASSAILSDLGPVPNNATGKDSKHNDLHFRSQTPCQRITLQTFGFLPKDAIHDGHVPEDPSPEPTSQWPIGSQTEIRGNILWTLFPSRSVPLACFCPANVSPLKKKGCSCQCFHTGGNEGLMRTHHQTAVAETGLRLSPFSYFNYGIESIFWVMWLLILQYIPRTSQVNPFKQIP